MSLKLLCHINSVGCLNNSFICIFYFITCYFCEDSEIHEGISLIKLTQSVHGIPFVLTN